MSSAAPRLYRADQMRRADEEAVAAGVAETLLMEAAGVAVSNAAIRYFPDAQRILVLCGKGNNGGDGFVAGRYLHLGGRQVQVLELPRAAAAGAAVDATGAAGGARTALRALTRIGELDADALDRALNECDLVIDALFGSGLTRPLEGELTAAVSRVNSSGMPVLAVDVPSGIDSDSPQPPGQHLIATRTVQLAGAKLASAFDPARAAFGEQQVVPIGIPVEILARASDIRLLTPEVVGAHVPRRERSAHKYQAGTVLVVAGSARYLGAAELACRGAHRAGAGLVTLAAEARLPVSWPETVFERISWDDSARHDLAAIGERRAAAVVAGPGLDERALPLLPVLIEARAVPWVLDAGALVPDAELRGAVARHGRCVITPHGGEAARLLGWSSEQVTSQPLEAAARLAREWGAICVLKGGTTVVSTRQSTGVYSGGHPGMASGGTGDVLAGVLGAFLASGGELAERVEAAVVAHGTAGRLAGDELGVGLTASDVIARLPAALAAVGRARP